MALQTATHTTSSTHSTTTTAPSTTPTDSDSEPGFSLSASPPLILAFLAVGMFAISMVVFFGWRRIAAGRTIWVPPPDAFSIGETPKLWDVWNPRERPQEAVTAHWHNIQPLAATVWDDTPLHVPANSPPPRPDSLAAAAFAHLRRRYRRRRSQQAVEMDPKSSNAEPLVRLQIAVTIAMPSPDYPSSSSWTDNEQPLEYSIGLYEMPWKKAH
ncbi:hypothetical protein B0H13DRAFT_458984 [Mycena leptocephala]|nr:hypothetical protein B0H13DRAFT_458984 [Mycena leptocephala]